MRRYYSGYLPNHRYYERIWITKDLLESIVIDDEGFRANVGIIIANCDGKVFWGKRIRQSSWQFPQGGIDEGETPLEAMYRELREETGLRKEHVRLMGSTRGWLRYRLPRNMIRHGSQQGAGRDCEPTCIGQKQRWYLLKLVCEDSSVDLCACDVPEFDSWRWVNYWLPAKEVVYFKRRVYERALQELAHLTLPEAQPLALDVIDQEGGDNQGPDKKKHQKNQR